MTPKSSQAMIANGLAGLNFPLSLTHFFNTELPTTHPLSGLVVDYLLAPSKTTTPQPVFSLNFSSAGKGPFMDSKAENIYFSKRGGVGAVEWGTWTRPGVANPTPKFCVSATKSACDAHPQSRDYY